MPVHAITSPEQLKDLITSGKPALIDFWATWCGACAVMSPIFEYLSTKTNKIGFYSVDIDAQKHIAEAVGIRSTPTFIFFSGGDKREEIVGADPAALERIIKTFKS
ncbi:thioredoxin [Coprinopsis marcescibilis]|uniref:Thioredoxin n=1 Tax=Coprinopsis marcescibilis TaxID=230819 RepID=A0A5C3KMV1_COPMA|nr:thioredoxin [Coprinopsis marcescibilis]